MPRKKITLDDGRSVVVNFDGEPSQQDLAEAAEHIGRHTTLGNLPGLRTINQLGKAFYQGGKEAIENTPALLKSLASHFSPEAPARDARALAAAAQHPFETAKTVAKAVMPFPESVSTALSGSLPQATTVAREAGQLVGSELVGKAPGLLKRGVRATARALPGAPVALHEMALADLEQARRGGPTEQEVGSAFARASAAGAPAIWMGNFRKTARSLIQHEMRRLGPASRDSQLVRTLRDFIKDSSQGWTPEKWKAELDRMGARLGSAVGTEGLSRVHGKQISALMKAMYRDVEAARLSELKQPAIPGHPVWQGAQPGRPAKYGPARATPATLDRAAAWREAQQLAHRAHGFNDLETMINRPGVISVTGDQYRSLNVNALLRQIDRQIELAKQPSGDGVKRAKRFVSSFRPGELETLRAKFDEIGGDLPRIPVGKGQTHGSGGKIVRTIITSILGEAAGQALGHPVMGLAVGAALPDVVGHAATTDVGRAAIKFAARIDPKIGAKFQHTLAALLRAQMSTQPRPQPLPPPRPQPQPSPTPSPQSNELLYSILKTHGIPPELQGVPH